MPTSTVDPATKLVPVTATGVVLVFPAMAAVGVRAVIVGTGLFTGSEEAADVPPPGAGFTAVMFRLPAPARSATVRIVLTCVALT